MKSLVVVFALIATVTAPAQGQECQLPSNEQVALELVEASFSESTFRAGVEAQLQMALPDSTNVAVSAFLEDLIQDFMDRYALWSRMQCLMALEFSNEFSAAEMREIRNFYRTRVGRKLVRFQPVILRRARAIGEAVFRDHGQEFEQMLRERLRQFERDDPEN